MDFGVPADPRIKLKAIEKKYKYRDLTEKQWNMKVTFVPIVIRALGTVTTGLIKGLEDWEMIVRVEAIQTTAYLRSTRILN